MNKKVEPKTLPGFMELMPTEQILFNQIKEQIRQTYEEYGFLPLDTPIIESSEVLLAKAGGETEKQIYRFNKGENDLSLRFDLTVPLAKYVSQYYSQLSFPFRRYQIGKVYRGEKPQKGRFREFYQCDIDIIGDGELNIANDAEIPSVIYNIFKNLGFDKFTICINNRKILNGLYEHLELKEKSVDIMRIIDKIEKIGKENVIKELQKIGVDNKSIELIMNFMEIEGNTDERLYKLEQMQIKNGLLEEGLNELKSIVRNIRLFGVPDQNFTVDYTIARGLDYYTGTVYETFLDEYKSLGSVCSGGRYDNLAEYYTDKKLPGVGISIGLTRLFYKLNEMNIIKAKQKSISKVLVISMGEDLSKSIETVTALRKAGISSEVYLNDKKIKTKFKYADKLKIPYVIVIGEDEIKNNVITLKNMENGQQEVLILEEAINKIKCNK